MIPTIPELIEALHCEVQALEKGREIPEKEVMEIYYLIEELRDRY